MIIYIQLKRCGGGAGGGGGGGGGGVLDAKQSRPPALANVLFLFLSVAFLP